MHTKRPPEPQNLETYIQKWTLGLQQQKTMKIMVQIWNSHDKSIKNTTNTKNTNNTDDTDNTDYSNKGLGGSGVAGKL